MSKIITSGTLHEQLEAIVGVKLVHASSYPQLGDLTVCDSTGAPISRVQAVDIETGEVTLILTNGGRGAMHANTAMGLDSWVPETLCDEIDPNDPNDSGIVAIALAMRGFTLRWGQEIIGTYTFDRPRSARIVDSL